MTQPTVPDSSREPITQRNPRWRPAVPSIDVAGCTARGRVRPRNEDQFLIASVKGALTVHSSSLEETVCTPKGDALLLAVADGMGGHEGGDVASALAIRVVAERFSRLTAPRQRRSSSPDSLPGIVDELRSVVAQCDQSVRRRAEEEGRGRMGTTLTIAYVSVPTLYVAHLGDSRCYLLRGDDLYPLTRDHTLAEEVKAQHGAAVADDSQMHHILTKFIGSRSPEESAPEVLRVRLHPRDILFLCSDGVTKHLGDDELARMLSGPGDATTIAEAILTEANARGGRDNITSVVARLP